MSLDNANAWTRASWGDWEAGDGLPAKFYLFAVVAYAIFGEDDLAEWVDAADQTRDTDSATPWAAYFWHFAAAGMPTAMYEAIERELVVLGNS